VFLFSPGSKTVLEDEGGQDDSESGSGWYTSDAGSLTPETHL
jgi:hypothetical protein